VSAILGGTAGLAKTTAGAVTLSAGVTHTYSGPTAVTGGKLVVNGALNSASAVTVGTGGTLSGTGTVGGTVALAGKVGPGTSVGTLTTGAQTWSPAAEYTWEIQDVDNGPGVGWDLLKVAGNLVLESAPSSDYVIRVVSLGLDGNPGSAADFTPIMDYEWVIATNTSGAILNFDAAAFTVNSADFANSRNSVFTVRKNDAGNALLLGREGTVTQGTILILR
jgi:autotransporter-associated beta strand protein